MHVTFTVPSNPEYYGDATQEEADIIAAYIADRLSDAVSQEYPDFVVSIEVVGETESHGNQPSADSDEGEAVIEFLSALKDSRWDVWMQEALSEQTPSEEWISALVHRNQARTQEEIDLFFDNLYHEAYDEASKRGKIHPSKEAVEAIYSTRKAEAKRLIELGRKLYKAGYRLRYTDRITHSGKHRLPDNVVFAGKEEEAGWIATQQSWNRPYIVHVMDGAELSEVITASEAATLYGLTREAIHKALHKLSHRKSAGTILIWKPDADRLWGKK